MTETSFPWFFWLFPVAFAVHNLEEAIWLPAWSQSSGRYYRPVGRFELSFAAAVITAISVIITILFYSDGKQSLPCYLFFGFNFGMFANVFFPHLAATIALRKYCPGLLTALFFLLPTTSIVLSYGYKNEFFLFPKFWFITIPFAALVIGSIPILFKIGRLTGRLLKRSHPSGQNGIGSPV